MHCAFSHSSFHPSLPCSLALSFEYEILSFSFIRCCQTRPPCQSWLSDSTYNFPPAICPLKRKIALDRNSPSKTTTINSYNCNGIGAVSPGPGRAFSHTEERCFNRPCPVISTPAQSRALRQSSFKHNSLPSFQNDCYERLLSEMPRDGPCECVRRLSFIICCVVFCQCAY